MEELSPLKDKDGNVLL